MRKEYNNLTHPLDSREGVSLFCMGLTKIH